MNPTDTESSAEAPAAPGPRNSSGRVQWMRQELKRAKQDSSGWRTSARECYRFYAGQQWSDEDRAILEEQSRIPVTFNRTARTVNAVSGLEIANRQEVRFVPREPNDAPAAELLSEAAKWIRDQCDAEDEESEAFRDLEICGIGWTETKLDYEEDPDGMLVTTRVDPLRVLHAPSDRRGLVDTKWRALVMPMTSDEVKSLWPSYDLSAQAAAPLLEDDDDTEHDSSPPFYDQKEAQGPSTRSHEIVRFEWWEREKYARVAMTNGQVVELPEDRFARLRPTLDKMGLKYAEQTRKKYKFAYLCGDTELEYGDAPIQSGFTLNCMTGMRDREKKQWFGLVHLMIDPQRWANKWLSQVIHILNSNAKGGLLAETNAFVNPRKAKEDWAKADSVIDLNPGGLEKIREKMQAQYPAGFDRLMQYAVDAISDTPGVNMELMGLVGQDQPGVLESMRKQAGVQMMGVLFDAMRAYRKAQGRITADYIRNYLSDGRMIRIVGDAGAQYVPLIRDALTSRYDVVVDEAPTSHNHKERVLALLMQLVPPMVQAGMPPPPPDVIKYLPLPTAIVEKWYAGTRPDPQKQAQQEQFVEAVKQTELKERNAKADLDIANAQKAIADAQVALIQAQRPPDDPRVKIAAEAEVNREKAHIQSQTEVTKALIQAETQRTIEQMRLAGQVPDDGVMTGLQNVVSAVQEQLAQTVAALAQVAQSAAEARQAAILANQPKRKRVNLQRGPDGFIIGADVEESATLQ